MSEREPNTIQAHWAEYTSWLAQNAPEAFSNLAPPATTAQVEALAGAIEPPLPAELVALLQLNNGQLDPNGCCALPGLEFLSAARIAKEWQGWQEFRGGEGADGLESHDDYANALDPGVVDKYTYPGWVPVFKDGWRADYVGVDMAPTEAGTPGQVINFGRDEDQHFVAFPSLTGLLAFWVELVREGKCRVQPAEPPDSPSAWFAHESNGIDVLRSDAAARRTDP